MAYDVFCSKVTAFESINKKKFSFKNFSTTK